MSASDIKAFVKARIAVLRHNRSYLHTAKTPVFAVIRFSLSIVLIHSVGNQAYFNHPAYYLFIGDYFFGLKGLHFRKSTIFTIVSPPAMAIVSTLVSLDWNIYHLCSAFNLSQADVVFEEFATGEQYLIDSWNQIANSISRTISCFITWTHTKTTTIII